MLEKRKPTLTEKLKDRLIKALGGYTRHEWGLCQSGITTLKKIAVEDKVQIRRLKNQVAAGSSDKVRSLEAEMKTWRARAMRAEAKNRKGRR